jgi:hypothetical protein
MMGTQVQMTASTHFASEIDVSGFSGMGNPLFLGVENEFRFFF